MELKLNDIKQVASELALSPEQVFATVTLLDGGATVPFIARYRKEATGSMDEVVITSVRDRMAELRELLKRREAILASLKERELLTDELERKVLGAHTMTELEDVYLPYKPKRRTRATIARDKGLEPLAVLIFEQGGCEPLKEAAAYIDPEKEVADAEEAVAGARDIIAEWVNESAEARERLRSYFATESVIRSKAVKGKEDEGAKFRDYFEWEEMAKDSPSHRLLAMRRGEREGFLSVRYTPPADKALVMLEKIFVTGNGADSAEVRAAVEDAYKRLLALSMEAELRLNLKKRADEEAVRVFKDNLRQLLLTPPLGQKNVMAIDPGYRTGCKVVCLDRQGALRHSDTIFPHTSAAMNEKARVMVLSLCVKYEVEAIAIGNGTAGRETETFIRALGLPASIDVVLVNESGASIYSASDLARKEFPDHDITVRGSVSIGRRLVDPLAELVKIDPKSIGVGQYQHDVEQGLLRQSLDDVVVSCVNAVGVEVNTASANLLNYVSGLGPVLSQNIVSYREEHGPFASRDEIKKVPRLGPKAFEQAAGFLRVRGSSNPLDSSAVHPESYYIVESMASDLSTGIGELIKNDELRQRIDPSKYISDTVGMPTLKDILQELVKPGRDPRKTFESFSFKDGVNEMKDLTLGMVLPGIVTNITNFGAFVDVGVHQDGLVHISQLSDRYVKNPADVVKVGQRVEATVLEIDHARRRIALSLRKDAVPEQSADKADSPTEAQKKPFGSSKGSKKHAGQKPHGKPRPVKDTSMADALRKLKGA